MTLIDALAWIGTFGLGPLWAALLVLLIVAAEAGYRIGRFNLKRQPPDTPAREGIGLVVGGMLGLLGFLLAISLSMADGRYNQRRAVVLDEANAIGTAWLRAGVLGGDEGPRLQALVAEYGAVRRDAVGHVDSDAEVARALAETQRLQTEIWRVATAVAQSRPTPVSALALASFNDMFDQATAQRRWFGARVPVHVMRLMLWTSILAVGALGYHFGMTGARQLVMSTLLLVLWSSSIVLIVDIDRPQLGSVRVTAEPIEWTLQGFRTP